MEQNNRSKKKENRFKIIHTSLIYEYVCSIWEILKSLGYFLKLKGMKIMETTNIHTPWI